jgi:hypothetical protein
VTGLLVTASWYLLRAYGVIEGVKYKYSSSKTLFYLSSQRRERGEREREKGRERKRERRMCLNIIKLTHLNRTVLSLLNYMCCNST